jgi:hypothetical protein
VLCGLKPGALFVLPDPKGAAGGHPAGPFVCGAQSGRAHLLVDHVRALPRPLAERGLGGFTASSHPWRWAWAGSITVHYLSKALTRIRVSRQQPARVVAKPLQGSGLGGILAWILGLILNSRTVLPIYADQAKNMLGNSFPEVNVQDVDRAIPTLPAISMEATLGFYRRLGFVCEIASPKRDYAFAERGSLEVHFFLHEQLIPHDSSYGSYFRVNDVHSLFKEFSALHLPATGIPRITKLEDKPWGMREFAIIDENGSLIRIGQPMASTSTSAESSMYLLFGTFLSGLVVVDFLKEASVAVHASLSALVITLFGAIWTFFVIFDTLVWLVYCKDHPSSSGRTPSPSRLFVHLIRRAIEFGSLIWLYDIINIVKSISISGNVTITTLERFSFNLGFICSLWLIRRLLGLLVSKLSTPADREDLINNSLRLFSSAVVFIGLWYLMMHGLLPIRWAYASVFFAMLFHIFANFRLGWRKYYDSAFPYYVA